ncbi:pyridoxamine 5'-phosphate oxidase family protein [Sulfurimonas sp. HSL-3221]|uniref:HugZ family pyridoxamine 5'-phosphate oxidase n=1 Tax=Sulfurimonadaceae TaxID=2771471 RepID=UPI001E31B3CC|nr:pyridoxamine 5'-phosphate oxidase family protein [Sulfurimonas sp. HSL-3221]UFS61383.1 pyridoxamine 5'-phosphate oxidase family protein [Sulfurimonas sp. HSL-3221]
MLDFLSAFRSTVIGTVDADGFPFSSYAPFIRDDHRCYVFISDIARHAANLRREGRASLFFIEDECNAANLFARKRVSLQCETRIIPRATERFDAVMSRFKETFNPELISGLMQMQDFNLYEFIPVAGEAVFGFGEAYTLGGEHMETLLPRRGGGHKKG